MHGTTMIFLVVVSGADLAGHNLVQLMIARAYGIFAAQCIASWLLLFGGFFLYGRFLAGGAHLYR
jgi:heme/copper-type cytochrome/quinol oxidase subunit 1